MHDICQTVINDYMIRKSKKQKQAFISFLKNELAEDKISIKTETYGDMFKSENIVVGNLSTAKNVFTAHYDTCATMFFIPNFCTPKNFFVYAIYQIALLALLAVVSSGIGFLTYLIFHNVTSFLLGFAFSMLFFYFALLLGPANKNNYNDNTSGVVCLLEMIKSLPEELKNKTCFIFFDNEEKGLIGSKLYNKRHKTLMKSKTIVNLDCISDGNAILCGYKNVSEKSIEHMSKAIECQDEKKFEIQPAKKMIYPSDQKSFPNYFVLTACNESKLIGYYLSKIHTKKDIVFDERNIAIICNGLREYMYLETEVVKND